VAGFLAGSPAYNNNFASNVDDRLSTLQTSSYRTLKVLATIKGTIAMERKLHRDFADDHIRGEWVRRSEAIESFVARTGSVYPLKGNKCCFGMPEHLTMARRVYPIIEILHIRNRQAL
jgi:hypothetical protein